MFEKYRVSKDFYTDFAGGLVRDVLEALPQVVVVQVGGNEGVDVGGPLVGRVRAVVGEVGRRVEWSVENGWRERGRNLEVEGGGTEEEEVVEKKGLNTLNL